MTDYLLLGRSIIAAGGYVVFGRDLVLQGGGSVVARVGLMLLGGIYF